MSTHNIGFCEDLTKTIFELSSNIIKYAPYFFCCNKFVLIDVVSCDSVQVVTMRLKWLSCSLCRNSVNIITGDTCKFAIT